MVQTAAYNRIHTLRCRIDDVRIREHLRRTERDLRQVNHPDLTPEQRRHREDALDNLREYWQTGSFPTNEREPGRTPCFVGANDVPCALAFLLQEDGRHEVVAEVMATDPTIRLEDVEDGPIAEWVEANGLTMAEAARIQPGYPYIVRFATDCGPIPCQVAWVIASIVGLSIAACSEYVGYRLVSDAFPDNVFKRRASVAYLTVMNLFLAPLLALLTFALFP